MILNGEKIKKLIEDKNIIENANINSINSCSYDVSISNKILCFKKYKNTISLFDAAKIENLYSQIDISSGYIMEPGESILVSLNEKINMPTDLCGHIRPRTSFSRLGIYINLQHINAGYSGILTILVSNLSPNSYEITPNIKIGQLVIETLDNNAKNLAYPNESTPVYQDELGLGGSKIYADYIGKVVRHFKGNYYFIENISMDSETKETMVVYKPLYHRDDSMLWNRPLKMFFEEIDPNREDNITKQRHRFEFVKELQKDYTLEK